MKRLMLVGLIVISSQALADAGDFTNYIKINMGTTISEDSKNYVNDDYFSQMHGISYQLGYSVTKNVELGVLFGVDFQSLDGEAMEDIKDAYLKNGKFGIYLKRYFYEVNGADLYYKLGIGLLKGTDTRKTTYTYGYYIRLAESEYKLSSKYYLELSVGADYGMFNFETGIIRKSYEIKEEYTRGYYTDENIQQGVNNVSAFVSIGFKF